METLQTEQKNKWYTLKVMSNFEDRVKNLIEKTLENEPEHKEYIYEVLMPSEIVTSVKHGKKKSRVRKLYPGYLFINMNVFLDETTRELNPSAYYFVTSINGVSGFIGGKDPVQLKNHEIDTIRSHIEKFTSKEVPKSYFNIGEMVTILDGPFVGLHGAVDHTDAENQKLKVLVSIFGRETPVELENWQVERYVEEK